jgi:predicted murein hydrolase (TIGR00659 family)
MDAPFALWVYLSTTPLLWLTLTVVVWLLADWLALLSGRNPLVNPVMIAIAAIAAILLATGTSYGTYFDGAQFVHFLLGPTTVAIAIPLYKNWPIVRAKVLPMLAALLAGTATSIVSAIAVAAALGVPHTVVISLAPKSVTAAVAMGISENLGGVPALTAVLVVFTGVLGAVIVTPLMNAMRLHDYAARGFAAGLAAHGIGTARAFAVDPVAGTFAGIAMGLSAVLSSLLIPVIVRLFFPTG